jgi:hypothetical protein
VHIEANGSAGGLLISWKDASFTVQNVSKQRNVTTVDLKFKMDSSLVRITGVYGPSSGNNRDKFLQQVRSAQPSPDIPWALCGDFNLVLSPADRSTHILWTRESFSTSSK